MSIKTYELKIVIDENGDELLHISERYECEESEDIFKLNVMGVSLEVPVDLQKCLKDLDSDLLGIT